MKVGCNANHPVASPSFFKIFYEEGIGDQKTEKEKNNVMRDGRKKIGAILGSKTVKNVQIDPQTSKIWSTMLNMKM